MVNAPQGLPLNFESKLITVLNKALHNLSPPFSPTSFGTTLLQAYYMTAHMPSFCSSHIASPLLHLEPWHLIFSLPETLSTQIFALLELSDLDSRLSSTVSSERSSLIIQNTPYEVLVSPQLPL